jgi:hypothetical protein
MAGSNVSKAGLVAEIESKWESLQALFNRLSEEEVTSIQDAQGWTIKDHILHLAAWERSVVYFLEGKPRHEGLGVDESLFKKGDFDEINEAIYRQNKDLSLAEATNQLQDVHRQLLKGLESLSDADLQRVYRRYSAGEEGEGEGPPVYALIIGNSADHYEEHQEWIQALLAGG